MLHDIRTPVPNQQTRKESTSRRGPRVSKPKRTSTTKLFSLSFFFFKRVDRLIENTPNNLLMQNVSTQLYTVSTTQKGQRLLICFESDLSALLHRKVDAACKLLQLFPPRAFKGTSVPFDPFICIYTVWLTDARPEHTGDPDMQN